MFKAYAVALVLATSTPSNDDATEAKNNAKVEQQKSVQMQAWKPRKGRIKY